jgi:hypothetical protein
MNHVHDLFTNLSHASCKDKYLKFGVQLAQTVSLLNLVIGLRNAQHSAGGWHCEKVTQTVFNLWLTAVTEDPTLYSLAYSFLPVQTVLGHSCIMLSMYLYASKAYEGGIDGGRDGRSRHVADAVSVFV